MITLYINQRNINNTKSVVARICYKYHYMLIFHSYVLIFQILQLLFSLLQLLLTTLVQVALEHMDKHLVVDTYKLALVVLVHLVMVTQALALVPNLELEEALAFRVILALVALIIMLDLTLVELMGMDQMDPLVAWAFLVIMVIKAFLVTFRIIISIKEIFLKSEYEKKNIGITFFIHKIILKLIFQFWHLSLRFLCNIFIHKFNTTLKLFILMFKILIITIASFY